jgi:hypothetical protein
MVVSMKMTAFWDTAPCILEVDFNKIAWRYIPEGCHFQKLH